MTHPLDTMPLDFSLCPVQQLRTTLMTTFDDPDAARGLMRSAGMSTAFVNFARSMDLVWRDVLDVARKQDRLRVLLSDIAKEPLAAAIRSVLASLLDQTPSEEAPEPGDFLAWKVHIPDPTGLAQQIASQSTLLDIAFLERGLQLNPAVVKLLVTKSDGNHYFGSWFRIGPGVLLTSHHVLFDEHGPAAEAWLDYERSFDRPEKMVGRQDHDWEVLRPAAPLPDSAPTISLTGAAQPKPLDRVYVIQYPKGEPKQIGMIHNVVVVTDDLVQYRSDTEGVSAGSPVFDECWQVAHHHRGCSQVTHGRTEYFSQGQRIKRVVQGLQAEGLTQGPTGGWT